MSQSERHVGETPLVVQQEQELLAEVRTRLLERPVVVGASDREIVLEIEANRFLRHMVRIIVGTLVEIGVGRRPASDIPLLLASGDRTKAGPTAPARGLCLVCVTYP